uniref:Endonuclease n=1 Tax=Iridovirus LCIVAC01 TaxID=2506607 RepID=A0A481YQM1_9VIRU|nr:MAG: hypothetical protein LCIVAC01_00790 [Iridovirus LCIVAC01]
MKNIINKKCICGKQPCFGFPGDKKPTCCFDCKEDGMEDIKTRRCKCRKKTTPCFGFPGDKRPTCCIDCKEDGMIDIKSRKCICGKRPSFGFPADKRPTCCKDCKKDRMIDINHLKCICGKRPNFGFLGDKRASCCVICRKDGMIDIKNNKCKSNERRILCDVQVNKNNYYDGYCTHCFAHLFPDHPKTVRICKRSKELQVAHHISSKYEGFLHDKPLYVNLQGGCCPSKRRIDLRKLIGNTLLCIEIDENQHRGYCPKDEENRYNDLFMDFSGKYIFIRYNPDKFKNEKGKKRNPKFETRIEVLEKEIEKHILRIQKEENKDLVEIYHLFFDL